MGNDVPDNCHAEGQRRSSLFAWTAWRRCWRLGVRGENYYGQLLARQIDWLTTLINSRDERFTYDLRIISSPDPKLYTRGCLTIALLCRIDDCTTAEGEDYAQQLLHLCEAFFESRSMPT